MRPTAYFNPPKRLPFVQPTPPAGMELVSLAINESSFGCSPAATTAATARLAALNRYPDPSSGALRAAIGRTFAIDPERIVCGNGSEELLDVVGRMFVRAGDEIIMSQSGFFQFAVVAARLGATLVRAPENKFVTDVEALAALVTERTRLVFLATPNNPTGVPLPLAAIERLHRLLPPTVVLLLDLAYGDYLPADERAAITGFADGQDNIVVTRTFSKAYGLAALRVGWLTAPEWMTPGLNMLRGVGNINAIAQAAATAAVVDQDFVADVVRRTAEERAFLAGHLARHGLRFVDGLGNFLLTEFPATPGLGAAEFMALAMQREGIWLRPVGEPGFANCIRIGLGLRSENARLVKTLDAFLGPR